MVKIKIRCPECFKKGDIEVDSKIISESKAGVTAITIAENLICKHLFIAYIDRNCAVRDSLIADFTIDLPEVKLPEEIEYDIPDSESIDIYLLTINVPPYTLACIIRACFYNKPILFINDFEVVNTHLVNFFEYIFTDSFEVNIFLTTKIGYKKNKKQFKNHIVIEKNKVIKDKEQLMISKNMKIENILVQKFFSVPDPITNLITIKNEIKKVYELSLKVLEFNNKLKENEPLSLKRAVDYLFNEYEIKISIPYLTFLLDIIEFYFKVELNRDSEYLSFLELF
jgi:hypothetical protein